MPESAVAAAEREAVAAAAGGGAAEGGGGGGGGGAADGRPAFVAGPGVSYVKTQARQRFCLNSFLALREAVALKTARPPLEGWMLKRGDSMSLGYLNRCCFVFWHA